MQSRLFHAVVAAGLSLGAASVVGLPACSDSSSDRQRVEGLTGEGGVDAAAPADAESIPDATSDVRPSDPDARTGPASDAGVDGDAGWPTTK
jgi:hypothetical protein